jgi:hypothetical protein
MADALTQIIQMAQTLESLLTQRYQAIGRGLHEKLDSVELSVPEQACKQIRFIATLRNKIVHEDASLAEEKLEAVKRAYRSVLDALDGAQFLDSLGNLNEFGSDYGAPYGLSANFDPVSTPKKQNFSQSNRPQNAQQRRPHSARHNHPNNRQNSYKRRSFSQRQSIANDRKRTRFFLLVVAGLFAIVVMLVLLLLVTLTKSKTAQPQQAPAAQAPSNPGDSLLNLRQTYQINGDVP